jgi:uncharacterized protein (TIGR03083 family)
MTKSRSLPLTAESARPGSQLTSSPVPDPNLLIAIAEVREQELMMLAALPAAQWDLPTLCEGWRVREVVAHQTMPFRYSGGRIALELLKSMGQFNRMADRLAKRDAATLSIKEQLASLRDNLGTPWKPPGGGLQGALCHDVIHGLDISTALGVDLHIPHEQVMLAIDQVTARTRNPFGTDLNGIELHAKDCDWTTGSGSTLDGSAQDLLLVYCGRKLPPGRLHGELAHKFTREESGEQR